MLHQELVTGLEPALLHRPQKEPAYSTLISDLQPPGLGDSRLLLLKSPDGGALLQQPQETTTAALRKGQEWAAERRQRREETDTA